MVEIQEYLTTVYYTWKKTGRTFYFLQKLENNKKNK